MTVRYVHSVSGKVLGKTGRRERALARLTAALNEPAHQWRCLGNRTRTATGPATQGRALAETCIANLRRKGIA